MNLNQLENKIIDCQKCDRLVTFREKIAIDKRKSYMDQEYWGRGVPGYGNKNSRLMILGLAPAAHGGNRTGRVFTGDKSASFLFKCLHHVGLANQANSDHRDDGLKLNGFIPLLSVCRPVINQLQRKRELCVFLEQEFRFLQNLKVVLGLGKIGFDACLVC